MPENPMRGTPFGNGQGVASEAFQRDEGFNAANMRVRNSPSCSGASQTRLAAEYRQPASWGGVSKLTRSGRSPVAFGCVEISRSTTVVPERCMPPTKTKRALAGGSATAASLYSGGCSGSLARFCSWQDAL